MKTSIDIASIVYKIIKKSNVINITQGGVYLGERPFNSKKNDIVVNTLTLDNEQLQFGTINVRIYAQNIHKNDTYYPNYSLLNDAVKILKPLLKDLYLEDESIYINATEEHYYKVENSQEWALVLKLETRNINN